MATFRLNPLTDHFACEVIDLDLAPGVDQDTMALLADALMQHKVLLFRDQQLTDAQYASDAPGAVKPGSMASRK